MKKAFFFFSLFSFCFVLADAQNDSDTVVNKREHGDQYLLSEPFEDSCMTLDIYEYHDAEWYAENDLYKNWQLDSASTSNSGAIYYKHAIDQTQGVVVDIAQPFYSDTALSIIGVAVMSPFRYYYGRNGMMCIADSNLTILRKTPIYDTPDTLDKIALDWLGWQKKWYHYQNYEEFFFDTAVTVQGKFYAVWEQPKPKPYTEYNWGKISDRTSKHYFWADIWVANHSFYADKECPATMLPMIRSFQLMNIAEDFFGMLDSLGSDYMNNIYSVFTDPNAEVVFSESDTTWKEVELDPPFTGEYVKDLGCYAYYIFPIFAVDTPNDSTDSSSLASMPDVDNFTFVFPNPTTDKVTIQCSYKMTAIELYNPLGQKTEEFSVNDYHKEIDVKKYPKGNYIIKVITPTGTAQKKLIIE